MNPNESITPDNPLLTAFALGELEGDAYARVAAAVAGDPVLEQAVQQIQQEAQLLRAGYLQAVDEVVPLSAELEQKVHERIEQAAAPSHFDALIGEGAEPVLASWRRPARSGRMPVLWWSPFVIPAAATFAAMAAVAALWWGGQGMTDPTAADAAFAVAVADAPVPGYALFAPAYAPVASHGSGPALPRMLMHGPGVPEALVDEAAVSVAARTAARSARRHGAAVAQTDPGAVVPPAATGTLDGESGASLSSRRDLFSSRPWAYLPAGNLSEEEMPVQGATGELIAQTASPAAAVQVQAKPARRGHPAAVSRAADVAFAAVVSADAGGRAKSASAGAESPEAAALAVEKDGLPTVSSAAVAAVNPATVATAPSVAQQAAPTEVGEAPALSGAGTDTAASLVAEAAALVRPISEPSPAATAAVVGAAPASIPVLPVPAVPALASAMPVGEPVLSEPVPAAVAADHIPHTYSPQTIAALEAAAYADLPPQERLPATTAAAVAAFAVENPPAAAEAGVAAAPSRPRPRQLDLSSAYVQVRLWVEAGQLPPPDQVDVGAVVRAFVADGLPATSDRPGVLTRGAAASLSVEELDQLAARVPLIAAVQSYAQILHERPADAGERLFQIETRLRELPQPRRDRKMAAFLRLLSETRQLMR